MVTKHGEFGIPKCNNQKLTKVEWLWELYHASGSFQIYFLELKRLEFATNRMVFPRDGGLE